MIFPLLSAVFLFSACEPLAEEVTKEVELEGQVFVVSADGESIPLSLVTVRVFERDSITRFLDEREAEIVERKEKLKKEIEEHEREVVEAKRRRREAVEEYRVVRTAIEQERKAYLDEVALRTERHEARIEGNETLIHELNEIPRPPDGVPTRAEFEAYQERRDRWYSMLAPEREIWREALVEQNEELARILENLEIEQEERIASWEEKEKSLIVAMEEYDEAIAEAERAVRELQERRARFPSVNEYFQGLPDPAFRVRTDANGEFLVVLPENRRMALVAQVNREIRDARENHTWFLWVDPAGDQRQKILLSNHNTLTLEEDFEDLLNGERL